MTLLFTSKGEPIKISDRDWDYAANFLWYIGNDGYPSRMSSVSGKRKRLLLHREIMSPKGRDVVDHINHDKADCQRDNLRICTNTENIRNGRKRSGAAPYKGISRKRGKWGAWIMVNHKSIWLGCFTEAIDAARAYDAAAIKHHGEFACINGV